MLFVMFSRSAINAPRAHKSDRATAEGKFRSKCAVRLTALRLAPSPDTRHLHRLSWRHSGHGLTVGKAAGVFRDVPMERRLRIECVVFGFRYLFRTRVNASETTSSTVPSTRNETTR